MDGAGDGTRTHMARGLGILSPLRLPVPPLRLLGSKMYRNTGSDSTPMPDPILGRSWGKGSTCQLTLSVQLCFPSPEFRKLPHLFPNGC